MKLDLDRVRENVRKTSTEDLLDRVTVYRAEMESAALDIIEAELDARGISTGVVHAHAAMREEQPLLRHPDGTLVRCSVCERPATEQRWRWHRLWGWFLPVFPRFLAFCNEHLEDLPTSPVA